MHLTSTIFACIALALAASEAAANTKPIPTIDLQARCRVSERTVQEMMGSDTKPGSSFETCMKSETAARDALQAAWNDIPASYKEFCVKPRAYSPSYIEWIACVELLIDLRKMRATSGETALPPSKRCPYVTYDKDGTITGVLACRL